QFPRGVLGFPDQQEYALIQTAENSVFYWLQAVGRPELAFVVCDPRTFVSDYVVPVKLEELSQIGLTEPAAAQVFTIVNKVDSRRGPTKSGQQLKHDYAAEIRRPTIGCALKYWPVRMRRYWMPECCPRQHGLDVPDRATPWMWAQSCCCRFSDIAGHAARAGY